MDGRVRLSNEWAPSGGIAASENEDSHSKLIRAGFLRQTHSGIFHLLPLGLRVHDKVVSLVDRYMRALGASRVQLSTISSEALWEQSGRLSKIGSELFRFNDRKEGKYLLAPTHEEEITALVARSVKSYKNLPLRLYQITQKYRDELRPRQGLLRGREFYMKDLYTFDYSNEAALETYEEVRKAYSRIFIQEMKLPVLVAQASSGDMGGNLSHEYHIPTALGEDHVMSCHSCGYVANEELAESRPAAAVLVDGACHPKAWHGISKDRKTLVRVWFNSDQFSAKDVSTHAVKQAFPDLDSGVEDPAPFWAAAIKGFSAGQDSQVRVVNLFDDRLPREMRSQPTLDQNDAAELRRIPVSNHEEGIPNPFRIREGDACPRCPDGKLKVQKAIELGHTFHLGTRYSEPLGASVSVPARLLPKNNSSHQAGGDGTTMVPIQMGCHGIGISRIIGAVADHLADERGLNWPRVIAPYQVVVVFHTKDTKLAGDAADVYDQLVAGEPENHVDAIIDDRQDASLGWKLKDADLVGYPVIVVLGREWKASGRVEVQCRRLGHKELVPLESLRSHVEGLLCEL